MDVIEEDSENISDFVAVGSSMNGGSSGDALDESMASEHSESTSEISENETDFAKQLRRQRRQVLEDGGPKQKQQDFSQVLRQHRNSLVESWEVHVPHDGQPSQMSMGADLEGIGGDNGLGDFSGSLNMTEPAPTEVSYDDDNWDFQAAQTEATGSFAKSDGSSEYYDAVDNIAHANAAGVSAGESQPTTKGSSQLSVSIVESDHGLMQTPSNDSTMSQQFNSPTSFLDKALETTPSQASMDAVATPSPPEGAPAGLANANSNLQGNDNIGQFQSSIEQQPTLDYSQGATPVVNNMANPAITPATPDVSMRLNSGLGTFGSQQPMQSMEDDPFAALGSPQQPSLSGLSNNNLGGNAAAMSQPGATPISEGQYGQAGHQPSETNMQMPSDMDNLADSTMAQPAPQADTFTGSGNFNAQRTEANTQASNGLPATRDETIQNNTNMAYGGTNYATTPSQQVLAGTGYNGGVPNAGLTQQQPTPGGTVFDYSSGAVPNQQQQMQPAVDDDFGDFHDAPAQSQPTQAGFDGFSPSQPVHMTGMNNQFNGAGMVAAQQHSQESGDDDFGDFVDAPTEQSQPSQMDSNFGLGGVGYANPTQGQPVQISGGYDTGMYGVLPTQQQSLQSSTTSDLFQSTQPQPPPESSNYNVGDVFSSATPAMQPAQRSTGNAFGGVFDATPAPQPPTQTKSLGDTFGASPSPEIITQRSTSYDSGVFDPIQANPNPPSGGYNLADVFADAPAPTLAAQTNTGQGFGGLGESPAPRQDISADDDFGDFEAASAQPTTSATAPDSFGEFGTAPTQTGDLRMADSTLDASAVSQQHPGDDNSNAMGDTLNDSPALPLPNDNPVSDHGDGLVQTSATQDSADDFGAFDTAPTQLQPTDEPMTEKSQPNTPSFGENFGGFESAQPSEPIEPSNFDAFNEHPAQAQATKMSSDAFGAGDGMLQAGTIGEAEPVLSTAAADDDFGDFNESPAQRDSTAPDVDNDIGDSNSSPAQSQGQMKTEEEDGFGGFDSAVTPNDEAVEGAGGALGDLVGTTQLQPVNAGAVDAFDGFDVAPAHPSAFDEFGDFDAAPPQLPSAGAVETGDTSGDVKAPHQLQEAVETDATEEAGPSTDTEDHLGDNIGPGQSAVESVDDMFGDFDSASAKEQPSEEQFEDRAVGNEETTPQLPGTDGDFGSFDEVMPVDDHNAGATPRAPDVQQTVVQKSGEGGASAQVDNDFGEFLQPSNGEVEGQLGDADTEQTPEPAGDGTNVEEWHDAQEEAQPTVPSGDDEFGDFDAAPSQSKPDTKDGYGSFDAAPSKSPPPEQEQNNENDFGDFGSAPSTVEPTATGTDDDFGAFDAAPTISQPSTEDNCGAFDAAPSESATNKIGMASEEEQNNAVPSGDDEFGAFDAVPTQPDIPGTGNDIGTSDGAPGVVETNGDGDFGAFDALPSSTGPNVDEAGCGVGALATATSTGDDLGDDEFGSFDAAPATAEATATSPGDDFGDFASGAHPPGDSGRGGAAESTPSATTNTTDEFGDFDDAPMESQADGGDDFGGFDAAPSAPQPAVNDFGTSDEAPPERQAVEEAEVADFGDFDTAPADGAPSTADGDDDFGGFDAAPMESQADDGDGFGDFDAAPSAPQPAVDDFGDFDEAPPQKQAMEEAEVEDFGDFDAAPASAGHSTADGGDDFGDFDAAPMESQADLGDNFGDFDAAPSVSQPSVDDFGDFDEAPKEEQTVEEAEVDDFGDFDAAPADAAPSTADADDDFGDFGAATSQQSPATRTDEDFGDFDSAGPQSAAPAAPPLASGPELETAKTLLQQFQNKYAFEGLDGEGGIEEEHQGSLLKCLGGGDAPQVIGQGDESMLSLSLMTSFKDMRISKGDTTSSPLIIENDGRGMYAHFCFPFGGLDAPNEELEWQHKERRDSALESRVPDVLPIHLPGGKQMPLEATSPKTARRKVSANTPMPELPPGDAN